MVMSDEEWAELRTRMLSSSSVALDVVYERIEHLRAELDRWEHTVMHRMEEDEKAGGGEGANEGS